MIGCDFCGDILSYAEAGTVVLAEYWTDQLGLRTCDGCLMARYDDFQGMRLDRRMAALRLRHSNNHGRGGINIERIDETIASARGIIDSNDLRTLEIDRDHVFSLHMQREYLAFLSAGQALLNAVAYLHFMIKEINPIRKGRASIEGGKKGAAKRKLHGYDANKRDAIIAVYSAGETRTGVISRKTGSSRQYVNKVLRGHRPKKGN